MICPCMDLYFLLSCHKIVGANNWELNWVRTTNEGILQIYESSNETDVRMQYEIIRCIIAMVGCPEGCMATVVVLLEDL